MQWGKFSLSKKPLILSSLGLMAVLIFILGGYLKIRDLTLENKTREEAEKLISEQQFLSRQMEQAILVLGIHNSFSGLQAQKQLDDLANAQEVFIKQHQKLNEIINGRWNYNNSQVLDLKSIFASFKSFSDSLLYFSRAIQQGQDKFYSNNYVFASRVRSNENRLNQNSFLVIQALDAIENKLESKVDMVNKGIIITLLATLFAIAFLITGPLIRTNTQNISRLKQSRQQIDKSDALLWSVLDSSPDLIFILDKDLKYNMANKAFSELAGLQQLNGANNVGIEPTCDFILNNDKGEEDLESFSVGNRMVITTGQMIYTPEMTIRANSHSRVVSMTRLALKDDNGGIWGMLGFAHDITKRVEAERILAESEKQYRYLFDSSPMPMWIFDLETFAFLKVNEKAISTYGYSAEEFSKMSILDIRPGSERKKLLLNLEEDQRESSFRGQWIHLKKNGERMIMEIVSHYITYQHRQASLVVAQDVTATIRMQRELVNERISRQRKIAQATINIQEKERNEIGKELHDNVNQILTSAKLHLDYMDIDGADLQAHRLTGIKLIGTAINEIRRLSKSLVPPTINDLGLIGSVTELVESLNLLGNVQFNFQHSSINENILPPGIKLTIFRIIQEQTTNILKHSHATNAFINLILEQNQLRLSIEDDGKGFDIANVNKGVGIANIRNRSNIYQGKVLIQSSEGKGCQLWVHFHLSTNS